MAHRKTQTALSLPASLYKLKRELGTILFLLGILILAGCASPSPTQVALPTSMPPTPSNQTLSQELDSYLTAIADEDEFSGAVLVARNGEIVLERAYGLADVANQLPNTRETRFQLASAAKPLTATAVMMLVQQNKLALDTRISEYLPTSPETWQNVTVRQLLSHTSGIPDYFTFDEFDGEKNLTPDAIIAAAKTQPLEFGPGSDFDYSNTNYVLLGKLIETASGQSYGEFLRQNIFDPLDMTATGRDNGNEPTALGYLAYDEPAETSPITNALGGGDLYSTVGDMYKFDRALDGDHLLSAAAREGMYAGGKYNYGLGWETQEWDGRRVVSHNGGIEGFRSQFTRLPDEDAVIIILSNLESFDTSQAAQDMLQMMYP